MLNFVQVQGQFRRIWKLDNYQVARRARGMDAPSQHENIALAVSADASLRVTSCKFETDDTLVASVQAVRRNH